MRLPSWPHRRANSFKLDVALTPGDALLTGFMNGRETEERLAAKIKEIRGVKSVKSLLKSGREKSSRLRQHLHCGGNYGSSTRSQEAPAVKSKS
jgi:hypothetical protein